MVPIAFQFPALRVDVVAWVTVPVAFKEVLSPTETFPVTFSVPVALKMPLLSVLIEPITLSVALIVVVPPLGSNVTSFVEGIVIGWPLTEVVAL